MKIKTTELADAALDWAVCEATGLLAAYPRARKDFALQWSSTGNQHLHPSTDWSQGGPIIEREGITVSKTAHGFWEAYKRPASATENYQVDSAALIAAMRCYVATKLGEEVEIPNELIGE